MSGRDTRSQKYLAVFCGSRVGKDPQFAQLAYEVGREIALSNFGLVYGGTDDGCMGSLATGVREHNGRVIGVVPNVFRNRGIVNKQADKTVWVSSLHERKKQMSARCSGALALPGGFGTLDEFFEILTWRQIGVHNKPIVILNYNGYYDSLINLIQSMHATGFVTLRHKRLLYEALSAKQAVKFLKKQIETNAMKKK